MKEIKKIDLASYTHLDVKNARVMIAPIDIDYNMSAGGIQFVDQSNTVTFRQGVIVKVGKGHYLPDGNQIPLDYEVGDFVYYGGEGTGSDFKIIRGSEYETVTVMGVESIYFVDGTGDSHELYELVDEKT